MRFLFRFLVERLGHLRSKGDLKMLRLLILVSWSDKQIGSQEMTEVCVQSPGCSLLPDLCHSSTEHQWGDKLQSHNVTPGK